MSSPSKSTEEEELFILKNEGSQILKDDKQSGKNEENNARIAVQILGVIIVSVGNFISGTTIPFGAVTLPRLAVNSTSDAPQLFLSQEDKSLYASIPSFGMLVGSLTAGLLANILGRKWSCIVGTCGSLSLSFCLISSAPNVKSLLIGRFFSGMGLAYATTISTLYLIETSTPIMRGLSGVIPALSGAIGVLVCQVMGAFVSEWRLLAGQLGSLNAPFFFMLLFIPETPTFLVQVKKFDEAKRVLKYLRGPKWDSDLELKELQESMESHSSSSSLKDLFMGGREALSPFLISLGLMMFFQFSGISIILNYTVDIFAAAGSTDQFMATVYVGIALLISNICTLVLVNKMRRRTMLSYSAMGISITLFIMGLYFHLKETKNEFIGSISWIPLVDLMIFIFTFNLGYGALTWVTAAEMLPSKVRSIATSLSVGFVCIISFLLTYSYPLLITHIQIRGVFWLYGSVSLLGFIYIRKFIPETKDKSEKEIQDLFRKADETTETPAPLAEQELC